MLRICSRHKANAVWVFGSVARGDDGPSSDIDLLVRLEDGGTILDVAHMVTDLNEELDWDFDVVTTTTRSSIMPRVAREALRL